MLYPLIKLSSYHSLSSLQHSSLSDLSAEQAAQDFRFRAWQNLFGGSINATRLEEYDTTAKGLLRPFFDCILKYGKSGFYIDFESVLHSVFTAANAESLELRLMIERLLKRGFYGSIESVIFNAESTDLTVKEMLDTWMAERSNTRCQGIILHYAIVWHKILGVFYFRINDYLKVRIFHDIPTLDWNIRRFQWWNTPHTFPCLIVKPTSDRKISK